MERVEEEFKEYLDHLEGKLPEKDKDYFKGTARPVYEHLLQEMEKKFQQLEQVKQREADEKNLQALLFTGNISIEGFKGKYLNMYPIISVNENVERVNNNGDRFTELELKSGKKGYLFSVLCECGSHEFASLDGKEIEVECVIGDNARKQIRKFVFRKNVQFQKIEKTLHTLFLSNRPRSNYFDIPICRRVMDVYDKDGLKPGSAMVCYVADLPGEVRIPVWNIRKEENCGSSQRWGTPYGLSGERNQFIMEFENFSSDMLDGAVEVKGYDGEYMCSHYDKDEGKLKLYTFDKKILEREHNVYQLIAPDEEESGRYLHQMQSFRCLRDVINTTYFQKEPTEGNIYYFINAFSELTGLELESMEMAGENLVRLSLKIIREDLRPMSEEYKKFLLELLNQVYVGVRFEER